MKRKIIALIVCLLLVALVIILFITSKKHVTKDNRLSLKYYNKGEFIEIKNTDISELKKDTYLLFVYNNFCAFQVPCDKVFLEFMEKYKIDIVSIPYEEFKKTDFYKTVLYAPSVLVIKHNKIVAYLDANSDDDIDKYQNSNEFTNWVKKYISLSK